jgi:ankyrin repeat protein
MNEEIIKELINNKADLNLKDAENNTPLHILSSCYFSSQTLKLFLDNNADVNLLNHSKMNPFEIFLQFSSVYKQNEIFEKFLLFFTRLKKINISNLQQLVSLCPSLFNEINVRQSIWNPARHHLFSSLFQQKTFTFLVCLKISFRFKIPKVLLDMILSFCSSILITGQETKRKGSGKKENQKKRIKN